MLEDPEDERACSSRSRYYKKECLRLGKSDGQELKLKDSQLTQKY